MHGASCNVSKPALTELPAIFYEREPGAASRPVPGSYHRREPERTPLHIIVRENLETLLDEARVRDESGTGYPQFVEHEFRRYLDCGILSRGFARVRCPSCGFERLVAFSCKGRLCPSCWARRTADIAAHLVDRVLPDVPYRQWVLTFPWQIRFLLAVDRVFLSQMLRVFLRTLFAWQRLRGRRMGLRDGQTGSVTFVQRFGGILNLNPHLHSILPDGLFVPGTADTCVFAPLPSPSDNDIQFLATRLSERLGSIAKTRLHQASEQTDPARDEQKSIFSCTGESLHLPAHSLHDTHDNEDAKPLCAKIDGFSLHAARTVAEHDREGLERLCRYGLRAPFSVNRLSLNPDGNVRYRLQKPWPKPDGKSEIILEPLAFLGRLVALLPAPYVNLVRYHGLFSNRSRFRNRLPKPPANNHSASLSESLKSDSKTESLPRLRPRRLAWAQLLRRVLHVDALKCAHCATPMVVLAFISDPAVINKILQHLGLTSSPPPVSPARTCPDEQVFFNGDFPDETATTHPHVFSEYSHTSRAPPD
jgi:hypothetical protein